MLQAITCTAAETSAQPHKLPLPASQLPSQIKAPKTHLLLQRLDDGVVGVDLQDPPPAHVLCLLRIAHGLQGGKRGSPSVLRSLCRGSGAGVQASGPLCGHRRRRRPGSQDVITTQQRVRRLTCARAIRSMLVDQPNLESTTMAGESVRRLEGTTFSTLSPRTCE